MIIPKFTTGIIPEVLLTPECRFCGVKKKMIKHFFYDCDVSPYKSRRILETDFIAKTLFKAKDIRELPQFWKASGSTRLKICIWYESEIYLMNLRTVRVFFVMICEYKLLTIKVPTNQIIHCCFTVEFPFSDTKIVTTTD